MGDGVLPMAHPWPWCLETYEDVCGCHDDGGGVYMSIEHAEGVGTKCPSVLGTVAHNEGLSCPECRWHPTETLKLFWICLYLAQCFLENRPSIIMW